MDEAPNNTTTNDIKIATIGAGGMGRTVLAKELLSMTREDLDTFMKSAIIKHEGGEDDAAKAMQDNRSRGFVITGTEEQIEQFKKKIEDMWVEIHDSPKFENPTPIINPYKELPDITYSDRLSGIKKHRKFGATKKYVKRKKAFNGKRKRK
jgi:hypothetical protein